MARKRKNDSDPTPAEAMQADLLADGYDVAISPSQARLIDAAADILGDPAPDDFRFLHAILAQCGLPYRQPPANNRDYTRQNGKATLVVSAGYLADPKTGTPQLQGLPYGAKPRLLLIHLCSEAVRRQSATIPIAESMSAFMRELGLQVTGGAKGSIGRFKDQLNRLAAARMQILFAAAGRATMVNTQPIRKFDVWFPDDPRQRVLWPSEVVLSDEFFTSLTDHALPLDPRAIRALQHSARGLDSYTFLAHRLPRVRSANGDFVSWAALHQQFGPDVAHLKDFRKEMIRALRQALAVYPSARVEDVEGGVRLHHSPPPIRALLPVRN